MTDLTAIKTPFGLLDRETQEALKAHGGPWEYYDGDAKWEPTDGPSWIDRTTYRVKPAPPKPRDFWISAPEPGRGPYRIVHTKPEGIHLPGFIHVREVLE